MERRLRIGRVGRAHSVGGAFHVTEPTEHLELLDAGRRVYLGDRPLTVAWRKGTPAKPVIKLETLDDRVSAESVLGLSISVPREEVAPLGEDEYLVDDLVGCEVRAERLRIGSVRDVLLLPSVEALVIEREDGTELLAPLVEDAIEGIDVEGRRIDVSRAFLGE